MCDYQVARSGVLATIRMILADPRRAEIGLSRAWQLAVEADLRQP